MKTVSINIALREHFKSLQKQLFQAKKFYGNLHLTKYKYILMSACVCSLLEVNINKWGKLCITGYLLHIYTDYIFP